MPTTFTISHTIDQTIIEDLEVEFEDFRSRIARLSMSACDVVADFFQPLGPVDADIIDLTAIEPQQYQLELDLDVSALAEVTIDLLQLEAEDDAVRAEVAAVAAAEAQARDTVILEFAA